jgi:hypothetical protein
MAYQEYQAKLPPVLDVSQRLLQKASAHPDHSHSARGTRVETVSAGPERLHYHRTTVGATEPSPNKPGHRHRLPDGSWTQPSMERWTSAGVTRL